MSGDVRNASIEMVDLTTLERHPNNPREGDVGAILESIATHGFYGVVVAQRSTRRILAGNHRWMAALQRGLTEIPVAWIDCDDDEAQRVLLADNRANDLASYNDSALVGLLKELTATPKGLDGTLWTGDDLDDLLAELAEGRPVLTDPDTIPPRPLAKTVPGDVWLLGPHRVMCGDSTVVTDVERLMDGGLADLVFADPPYGMSLDPRYDSMHTSPDHHKTGDRFAPVLGDEAPFDPAPLLALCHAVDEQFWWGADYYRRALPDGGSWVVWDKRSNDADMDLDKVIGGQFELCWSRQSHRREIARILWSGHHGMQSEDTKKRVHPTQKPVALVEWFLQRWAKAGGAVLDPFGGSGSTLIAAHHTGRTAYLMELDPGYVDVICRRYQEATGDKPIAESTGNPHDFTDD